MNGSATKQAKKAQQAAEREAGVLRADAETQRKKAAEERRKATLIRSRAQRARGGGSYEANPNPVSTKLG